MGESLYIIGTGGHSKMVTLIAEIRGFDIVGYLETNPRQDSFMGRPVYLQTDFLKKSRGDRFAIAVGENDVREAAVNMIRELAQDAQFPVLIDPSAVVAKTACLGEGTIVFPGAIVNTNVQTGVFGILNSGSILEHDCVAGDFVSLAPGASVCGECVLGRSAYIAAGATVIHGLKIGVNAVVGAGSVLVRDLGPGEVAIGVPAKPAYQRKPGQSILGEG